MTEWRVSPSFPNYEVSEDGNVRTRFKSQTRSAGRVLSGSIKYGYQRYDLWVPELKRDKCVGAHGLVCEAWHGPSPSPAHEPAHWDGDRLNNHFSNLRWATRTENAADKLRHGIHSRGERNAWAVLSDAQVRDIRAVTPGKRGWQRQLAAAYGVTEGCISSILSGRARQHA